MYSNNSTESELILLALFSLPQYVTVDYSDYTRSKYRRD